MSDDREYRRALWASPAGRSERSDWFELARRVAAIAQTGLEYSQDDFDRDRYAELARLAVSMIETQLDGPMPVEELFPRGEGYPTPKVDVRGVVFRDREILLVRERSDGCWSIPGGWADHGHTAREMVEREVAEESGYVVRAHRVLAVWDRARHNTGRPAYTIYKILVDCELLGGEAKPDHEILDVGWFALDALPPLSTGRTTQAQIDRLWTLHCDPAAPADLD